MTPSFRRRSPSGHNDGSPSERRGSPARLLVVGLGNPGAEYAGTRHNVGAEVAQLVAERHGGRLKMDRRCHALVAEVRVPVAAGAALVVLAFPQTYMNDSGLAVRPLVRRYSVDDLARLVVVHDEMDLPPGTIKVKCGGGIAGHKGLESIRAHLHDASFTRVRIGIGKPPGRQAGVDYVLKRLGKAERELMEAAVLQAAEAVETILTRGAQAAMNAYNG